MSAVFIAGPAAWNTLVVLDRLPEPVPHMQFAEDSWQSVGGTSAGKALALTALGRRVVLHAGTADDDAGRAVREALGRAGVPTRWFACASTERHLNLMTGSGERVSLYLATADASDGAGDARVAAELADASVIVLDLAAESLRLLPLAQRTGRPIWTDVHDYDGEAEFHRPFLAAADAVFCNADRLDDPAAFLRARIAAGSSLAVCTLGADGAIAVDVSGELHRVAAVPVDVVDTNGAGDAFFAGVLDAVLAGAAVAQALQAGACSAATALRSRHLHPLLDAVLDG